MNREKTFTERQKNYTEQAAALTQKHNLWSTIRVLVFLAGLVFIIVFANQKEGTALAITVLIFPVVFGIIVNRHARISRQRDEARNLASINEGELQRLKGQLHSFDEGSEFVEENHPYLYDMDVFGRNSLYQLLNRTNTPTGKQFLADWLKEKNSTTAIVSRQKAVAELTEKLDWRQQFQASGMTSKREQFEFNDLISWINAPNVIRHQRWTILLAFLLPLITLTFIGLNIFNGLSFYFTLGMGGISALVLKKYAFYVTNITNQTNKSYDTLKAYAALINIIEQSDFESDLLTEKRTAFIHDDVKASKSIRQLQSILEFLNGRANWFYVFLNLILLFDIHLLLRAEKWKLKQRGDVSLWFENIGMFEAINSLAGFSFANPHFAMPEISEEAYAMEAKALGHPLIKSHERVTNDFTMTGKGSIALITGSNMSGKSTFLRTIGVNMILAYAGAPVCADKMSLSIMQLFTSMRTEDNLEEHISSFYAELKRIKKLLQLVEKGNPVLFMLDEILKGTNSEDRHAGAEALIRQLSPENVMGFVSTHDLALGKLADELEGVENYSFNSEIKADKIIFNYHLDPGLCRSFNASKLMEQIGINIGRK